MEREKQKKRKADDKRKQRLARKAGLTKEVPEANGDETDGTEDIENDQSTVKNETDDDVKITDE